MSTSAPPEGDDLLDRVPSTFSRAEITLVRFEQYLGTIVGMLGADFEIKIIPLGEADPDGNIPVKRTVAITRHDASQPISDDNGRRLLASLIERNGGEAVFY